MSFRFFNGFLVNTVIIEIWKVWLSKNSRKSKQSLGTHPIKYFIFFIDCCVVFKILGNSEVNIFAFQWAFRSEWREKQRTNKWLLILITKIIIWNMLLSTIIYLQVRILTFKKYKLYIRALISTNKFIIQYQVKILLEELQ